MDESWYLFYVRAMTQAEQYDVVVVGSGGGALTGALLAARAGLRTLVVEKTEYIGGTSAYSGGACWLPGTDVQQRAGLPDSTEGARTYLNAVLTDPDQDKLEAFVTHAPVLVAELEAMGIDFVPVPFPDYFDAPGRVPGGRSIQVSAVKRDDLPAEVAPLVRPPVELDRIGQGRAQRALRRPGADRAPRRGVRRGRRRDPHPACRSPATSPTTPAGWSVRPR